MVDSTDPNTLAACVLGEKLMKTVGIAKELRLSPELASALCTARIGVSSLEQSIRPGCGAGPELRSMADMLHELARVAGHR